MVIEKIYMQRAFELAALGRGSVSPNPMVGCVIVAEGQIIGEGWHRFYGGPHAEVEAVNDAIEKGFERQLAGATAYVTLEPCSHYGKTPPCADLLVERKIKHVVVANEDPNPLVAGKGLEKLRKAGIETFSGVMEGEGEELNRRFFLGMREQRPWVILKWAQSRDGYLSTQGTRVKISGELVDMVVHKWRTEEDAILVGKQTVLIDNPRLNVRNWNGKNPVRLILDRHLETVSGDYHINDKSQPTVFINTEIENLERGAFNRYAGAADHMPVGYLKIEEGSGEISALLRKVYVNSITSVIVEGGGQVLRSFIESGLWDELRIIQGNVILGGGVKAPPPVGVFQKEELIGSDIIRYFSSPK